jgi:hypothetical protein
VDDVELELKRIAKQKQAEQEAMMADNPFKKDNPTDKGDDE